MWGKRDQVIFWITAYLPLFLIMFYRFIDSNNYFKKTKLAIYLAQHVNKLLFDVIVFLLIITLSLLLYRFVTNWYFNSIEKELNDSVTGVTYYIREFRKVNVNDYTFFLMTLLLPLISLDHSSIMNLLFTVLIIGIVITIYVTTNFIAICPLFFTSGRYVFRGTISEHTKAEEERDPSLRKSVVIITNEKSPNLNHQFKGDRLIDNIYYIVKKTQY